MRSKLLLIVSLMFMVLALLFLTLGCSHIYDAIGLSKQQAEHHQQDDQEQADKAVGKGRDIFWQCVSGALALVGGAVSGCLGVKAHRANRVNTALVKGVERSSDTDAKTACRDEAAKAGVGQSLHRLVKRIT